MLLKSFSKTGAKCRVTFKLPPDIEAESATLVGDFDDWNRTSHPMKELKSGGFSYTMWLETGKKYRYRYLLDGERWENDWDADEYQKNPYGTEDSILDLTDVSAPEEKESGDPDDGE